MKILPYTKNYSYSEESQDVNTRFSLLNKIDKSTFQELCGPVKCRDFFGEALVSSKIEYILPSIYGFKVDEFWKLRSPYIYLYFDVNKDNFLNKVHILNDIEREHFKSKMLTRFFVVDEERLVIKVCPVWVKSPILLSLFTFIVRLFTYSSSSFNNLEELLNYCKLNTEKDGDYIKNIQKYIDISLFLSNYKSILGDNPLTGINDKEIINLIKQGQTSFYHKNKYTEQNSSWTISYQHNMHGMVTCAKNISRLLNDKELALKGTLVVGFDWAYNYFTLIGDSK